MVALAQIRSMNEQAMEQSLKPHHVVLLASPGMGHLIPIAELAKRLVKHHNFTATVVTFSGFSSQSLPHISLLSSLPTAITSLPLPHIPLDNLPPDARAKTPISTTIARSQPLLRDILLDLKSSTNLAAFVVDNLGLAALPVAKQSGVPGYLLFTSCLTMLSVELHLPEILNAVPSDLHDHPDPLDLPGCGATIVRGRDLPEPIRNRSHPGHKLAIRHSKLYLEAAGILVNSFDALEPGRRAALQSSGKGIPPVYPIGPLVRTGGASGSCECLRWLDLQPEGSVAFVSFGSAGALQRGQAAEIAAGLEMSKMRFLWVVKAEEASFLAERTRGVGKVAGGWAAQAAVLGHAAVGGFVTHCGWNSVMEGLANGVAMAAWPLRHEQPVNAGVLAEEAGAAVRVRMSKDGLVGREEVCRVVRELMEGEGGKKARERAGRLKEEAVKAVGEGGESSMAFARLVRLWTSMAMA